MAAARKRGTLTAVIDADEAAGATTEEAPAIAAVPDQADEKAADTAGSESAAPAATPRKTRSPRKKSDAAPSTAAKKTPAKKAAAKKPAKKAPARPAPEPVRVLSADSSTARRKTLYLHPEDDKALGMAKLEDGIELNTRIRSMIALYRHNERFRNAVDKAARTAPRGGM